MTHCGVQGCKVSHSLPSGQDRTRLCLHIWKIIPTGMLDLRARQQFCLCCAKILQIYHSHDSVGVLRKFSMEPEHNPCADKDDDTEDEESNGDSNNNETKRPLVVSLNFD